MTTHPPHYRRNFAAFLGDYVGFALAMTFASTTTVLPNFVAQLTDSEVAVGLVATVRDGAWLLPQLIFAHWLTNKRRKKPYVVLGAVVGRPLYLLYAVALILGLARQPVLALASLLVVQFVLFGSDALAAVAWFDVLGKAIPQERRGRLLGAAQLISGLLAIGVGALIAALLSTDGPPFPDNYAAILALSGGCLLFSLLSWSFVIEPDEPVEEQRSAWRDYLPQLINTLRQDRAFARLIVVRLLVGCEGLALGFYILFATRELGLPEATVGWYTAAQTAGRILSSVALGALAERAGSHRVVQVATGLGMTAPLVGLALALAGVGASVTTSAIYAWVFVVSGIVISSGMLGHFNYVLDLAPAGQRPTYVGLFNTISGVLIVLPPLGGWLLRTTSYGVLFGLTAALLILAHVLSLSLPSAHPAPELQPEPVI